MLNSYVDKSHDVEYWSIFEGCWCNMVEFWLGGRFDYMAGEYAKQDQWAAQICRDLGVSECVNGNGQTVQMFGDNQGAIALVKNPHLHERSKHIDICYHFIRDLTEQKKLEIEYIPTAEMIADAMTKPLTRVSFERFKGQLGVVKESWEHRGSSYRVLKNVAVRVRATLSRDCGF